MTTENALPMECKSCKYSWDELLPLPMDAIAVIKRVQRLHCPKCDADSKQLLINFSTWYHRAGPPT